MLKDVLHQKIINNSRVRNCSMCRPVYLPQLNNRFKWKKWTRNSQTHHHCKICHAANISISHYGMLTLLSRPNYVYTTSASYRSSYASECWAPTKADMAHLDAFDQWCLRRLLGITWQDHITNIEVRERTGVPAVSETISQRRLSMLGHMSRMPPSADAYKAIYQDIPSDWRRRPGRPQQSWLATIHRDLQKLDTDLDNNNNNKTAQLSQRRPRDAPNIWVPWKFFRVLTTHPATFPEICNGLLLRSILRMCVQNLKFA